MLTRDEFDEIRRLMHLERMNLRSKGIEWDVADVMGVLKDFIGEKRSTTSDRVEINSFDSNRPVGLINLAELERQQNADSERPGADA